MDPELLLAILPQVFLDGLTLGFMYALIALGYTMVYGVLEFINFAHSEIFVVGAFVGVEILLSLQNAGMLEGLSPVLALLLILAAGMTVSGALAVAIERVAYRPLRGAPRLIPLISAIGTSFFLQDLVRLIESIWRNAFRTTSGNSHGPMMMRLRSSGSARPVKPWSGWFWRSIFSTVCGIPRTISTLDESSSDGCIAGDATTRHSLSSRKPGCLVHKTAKRSMLKA